MEEAIKPLSIQKHFSAGPLVPPGFENEVCVVLGSDLQGADLTIQQVLRALDHCHPALEICETRGDVLGQTALMLADNTQ